MNALTPLAVSNADILRALAAGDVATKSELARAIGKDDLSNLNKSLKAVEAAGLVVAGARALPALTEAGRAALAAITRAEGADAPADGTVTLRHDQLAPHPLNPRTDFDSPDAVDALDMLRESILTRGLKQNLVARAQADANGVRWIIAGERRWRAIGLAIEDGDLPADFPIRVLLDAGDDEQQAVDALIENMLRRDLNPIEEGRAFKILVDRHAKTTADIAQQVGRSRKHVQDRIALVEKLSAEDQARMALPKDHPDHLTFTDARFLMQDHRETSAPVQAEAPQNSPPAAEVALTPAQVLILVEVDAAIRARPQLKAPLGPTASIKNYEYPTKRADVQVLVAEGMLAFNERDPPNTVTLLKPGQLWLANRPGAFMDTDYKLQMARRAVGLSEIQTAKHELDASFETTWLNVPPPPKPAELTSADALILLEIRQGGDQHDGGEVAWDFDPAPIADLLARQLLHAPYTNWTGRNRVRITWEGQKSLDAAYPGWTEAAKRAKHLAKLRAEILGEDAVKGLGEAFATEWLNGPFELSPDQKQKEQERAEQEARNKATREAHDAAVAAMDARIDTFTTEAPTMSSDQLREGLVELLAAINGPAPWRPGDGQPYEGIYARAANGGAIKLNNAPRAQRLVIIAVNIAAGIPADQWAPPASGALDRAAFEVALFEAISVSDYEDDEPLDSTLAARAVRLFLTHFLEKNSVAFGAATTDAVPEGAAAWSAEHARELAETYDVFGFAYANEPEAEDSGDA